MDFFEAVQNRYSCRSYQPRPVEEDKLNRVLEAVRLAPSAKNLQDWRFVVVTDKETRQKMQAAARNQAQAGQAPVVIAACSGMQYRMHCGQPIGPIDVAIALEHLALAATSLGLATCWIGSFYPDQVRRVLGIPSEIEVVELMVMGYPADEPKHTKRLPLEKIACRDKWTFKAE